MDKVERANRRAKDAIIAWLLASERHTNEETIVQRMLELENQPYHELLRMSNVNLNNKVYPHTVMINHVYRCVRLAEEAQAEAQQKKQGRQLQEVGH